jgi:6,7-dimethyl-8-ribityllumazine synthase
VEIPLVAQSLAKTGRFAAIICLGAVIRGETGHYDYVCGQVSDGCQRVALDNDLPIIFGVLTTDNEEQALDRVGGRHGHKGREAADTAVTMISLLCQIEEMMH